MRKHYVIDGQNDIGRLVVEEQTDGSVALSIRSTAGDSAARIWLSERSFEDLCDLRYRVEFKDRSKKESDDVA